MTDAHDPKAVTGIPVSELRDAYQQRGLDRWSDAELLAAVGTVVSQPRLEPADSFILHAPLELAARAALLPLVAAPQREEARLHILAVAAQVEQQEPAVFPAPGDNDLPPEIEPTPWLISAIAAGDLSEVDRAAKALAARSTGPQLARALGDLISPLTAAAGHAPIFLYHLSRLHPLSGLSTSLLRPLARELARRPEWRIRWIDDRPAPVTAQATDPTTLAERLRTTPLLGVPGSSFIHPLLMQVDDDSVAFDHLAPALGAYGPHAARAVLRVAARSMLEDDPGEAPYGWTHCLTMPQAVLGLAPQSAQPDRVLAIAATHVMAFRAGLGRNELPSEMDVEVPPVQPTDLATAVATSHDAHVAKYGLACLEAAAWDPDAASVYLGAGQRLLDIWAANGGDPTDPLG